MKYYDWSNEKKAILKEEHNISFEEVVFWITNGGLLEVIQNPNSHEYAHQRVFVVNIEEYVYYVPFVEDTESYFLKTIYPSRKATKKYLNK